MFVQVPPRTNFHALPWKSTVEVPWQVVPAPAAQAFCPLRATPKHFSLCAARAASPSAFVSGAAEAIVARGLDRALARTSDVIVVFADIISFRVNSSPPSRPHPSVFEVFVRDVTRAQVKTSESVTEQRARTFRITVES